MAGNGLLRVGIDGPVGAGKTTVTEQLSRMMAGRYSIVVTTNDISTPVPEIVTFLQEIGGLVPAHEKGPV